MWSNDTNKADVWLWSAETKPDCTDMVCFISSVTKLKSNDRIQKSKNVNMFLKSEMKWEFTTVHEKIKPGNLSQKYWSLFYIFETFFFEQQCFQYSELILFFLAIVTLLLTVVLICDRILLFKIQFIPNSIDTEMKFP